MLLKLNIDKGLGLYRINVRDLNILFSGKKTFYNRVCMQQLKYHKNKKCSDFFQFYIFIG